MLDETSRLDRLTDNELSMADPDYYAKYFHIILGDEPIEDYETEENLYPRS